VHLACLFVFIWFTIIDTSTKDCDHDQTRGNLRQSKVGTHNEENSVDTTWEALNMSPASVENVAEFSYR
jgi:hypothetical protein